MEVWVERAYPGGLSEGLLTSWVLSTEVMGREGCRRFPALSHVRKMRVLSVSLGASENPTGPVEKRASIVWSSAAGVL